MKYENARGYTAEVVARNDERVIYHAWDERGDRIQNNCCRSPEGFDRDWFPVTARRGKAA